MKIECTREEQTLIITGLADWPGCPFPKKNSCEGKACVECIRENIDWIIVKKK